MDTKALTWMMNAKLDVLREQWKKEPENRLKIEVQAMIIKMGLRKAGQYDGTVSPQTN